MQKTIIGAGYSGLIAAYLFPQAEILEASAEPANAHRAVLRFRSDRISALTGIEFRCVRVRKAIWANGRECAPTIALANSYSRKLLGRAVNDRSIWHLDPVDRWIAPETLYEQMIDAHRSRIEWSARHDFSLSSVSSPVISTAPLPIVAAAAGFEIEGLNYAPITVERFRIPNCDVFQTIYFPQSDYDTYRASITGDMMIIESTAAVAAEEAAEVVGAFGFSIGELRPIQSASQRYGKISPFSSDFARRSLLARLSTERGIYSLGRFATWRNVLLDDLPHDCAVIRRLLAGDRYDTRLELVS